MFRSILFAETAPAGVERAPDCFADLHLDQVVDSVIAGREEYDLAPFFWQPLRSVEAIAYRQEVFRELEDADVAAAVERFSEGMREMRRRLARVEELRYTPQRQRWFLDAVGTYGATVERLAEDLQRLELRSHGFSALRDLVVAYAVSPAFAALRAETAELEDQLAAVDYALHVRGDRVTVRRFEGQVDYSREVLATFEKFRQGAVDDYRVPIRDLVDMNHVEAEILARVALLYPDEFGALEQFCGAHGDYLDDTIGTFDREVQFYVAYADHARRLALPFCHPEVSDASKEVCAHDTFDLALAGRLVPEGTEVVCNDLHLDDPERILVVSGPNQGGKTTFARTFGQLHHLAALGCPVPGREARLFLCDAIFTHFEQEEDISDLSGKLEMDLQRMHAVLTQATPRSVVVMNESFSSTTLQDARFLGTRVLEQLIELDALCVYVTFVDELSALGETTVSMVSAIVPDDPARRTFTIERRPADGLAYAAVLAERHGLTYEALRGRVAA